MHDSAAFRLSGAVVFSTLIHVWVMYGVAIKTPSVAPRAGHALQARVQITPAAVARAVLPDSPSVHSAPKVPPAKPAPSELPMVQAPQPMITPPNPAPPMAVPVMVDPTYYPTRELDVFPTPTASVTPPFPLRATNEQVSGYVNLELLIDEAGAVMQAKVLEASPRGYFEVSAIETFKSVHFSPAQKHGHAVRSRLAIKVDFTLDPEVAQKLTRAIH